VEVASKIKVGGEKREKRKESRKATYHIQSRCKIDKRK
jgi:hypothetical protein